jgi:hypothetical protein
MLQSGTIIKPLCLLPFSVCYVTAISLSLHLSKESTQANCQVRVLTSTEDSKSIVASGRFRP